MDIKKFFQTKNPAGSKPPVENPQPSKSEGLNKKQHRNNGGGGDNDDGTIRVGDCFTHRETKQLYQITGIEQCKMTNPETDEVNIVPLIVYMGLRGKVNKLNLFAFVQRFEKTFKPIHGMKVMEELSKRKDKMQTSDSDTTQDGENPPLGMLYIPTERHTLDNMVIYPEAKEEIIIGLNSINKQEEMEKIWGLSKILDEGKRQILNFYGPSGCGKTMAARCVANFVKKKLFQVDYSQVVDKYVGETAKKISQAFATAKEKDAILFFDEADSLLSKRVDMNVNADYANSVNQNRNVLMQELDKFNGPIIMSTNFFNNYDDAMLRRINRHIEFKLPNVKMREKLIEMHIPNLEKARGVNFTELAVASKGMSGGDVKNFVINAIEAISCRETDPEKWNLTNALLLEQIEKIKSTKKEHKKAGSNNREDKPQLGFGASFKEVVEVD